MKKIKLFLMMFILMLPISVRADHMYSIDMKIDIAEDGTANVTEVWDVKATSGSEWYKTMYNLGNSELSNFVVYMDGKKLTYDSSWNIDDGLVEKAGYYGINNTEDGIELCFGKYNLLRHTFTLEYTLSNYIFNTSDSQVLYWTLLPEVTVDYFTVQVTSYYEFPDTLDVWGYGYKGYAYVKEGKISMSNESGLNGDYVVLLAKFPVGTFRINNTVKGYDNFNDVFNTASEGTYEYDYNYGDDTDNSNTFKLMLILFLIIVVFVLLVNFVAYLIYKIFFKLIKRENKYGYINNKKIIKENVSMYRDIPCNKDIYYANILIKLNNFDYNKFNIFGTIILKWIKEGRIVFKNKKNGIFDRETSVIDLNQKPIFDNYMETKLYEIMYNASDDNGLLEAKELEKYVERNYESFLEIFEMAEEKEIDFLKAEFHIYNRISRKECRYKNVMDEKIYNDSVELYGLKKYLEEFSRMNTKEVMDVKLWNEYLMFAYLFGIADKVAKQLKDMYPEILEQTNFDYNTIRYIDRISDRIVSSANNTNEREKIREVARVSAKDYSAGGGGFSSGGGGGGSFGGGGGSMGGR